MLEHNSIRGFPDLKVEEPLDSMREVRHAMRRAYMDAALDLVRTKECLNDIPIESRNAISQDISKHVLSINEEFIKLLELLRSNAILEDTWEATRTAARTFTTHETLTIEDLQQERNQVPDLGEVFLAELENTEQTYDQRGEPEDLSLRYHEGAEDFIRFRRAIAHAEEPQAPPLDKEDALAWLDPDMMVMVDRTERSYLCSISGTLLTDPLTAPCKHSFNRDAILSLFGDQPDQSRKCPMMGCDQLFRVRDLKSDSAVREAALAWKESQDRQRAQRQTTIDRLA